MSGNSAKHANPMPINAAATLVARLGHLLGFMANFGGEFSMGSPTYAGTGPIININRAGARRTVLHRNAVSQQTVKMGQKQTSRSRFVMSAFPPNNRR
jgi:hypothetical protein